MSRAAPDALPALQWSDWSTRYLFFTGKGGVGKTTTASAVAIALSDAGKRTLVISTDPASNLDDLFGITASPEPTPVPGVDGLFVANLDPEAAALAFKERAVGPYRGVLPESAVRNMEEQLSGACTVEIAAFNEFTAVLAAPQNTAEFDHVIFDTAPTGHTLRLLTLPSAWSGYVAEHPSRASCLGPLAGLDQQREQYAAAVATLADPELTTLVLVSGAETTALREAARASHELAGLGLNNQRLIINGLLRDPEDDAMALAFAGRQSAALAAAPAELEALPAARVSLVAGDVTGIGALRQLAGGDAAVTAVDSDTHSVDLPGLSELLEKLDAAGNGLVMTMGKGGVGKTTLAAAVAVARTIDAARSRIVVLDTAPTGHTLLLLDAAQSYQREVQRTNANVPDDVSELLARLRDPGFARILVVTLAESTPVHEAERLQADLRCAGIEPFGWVINASLAPGDTRHPMLRARAGSEAKHIEHVQQLSAGETWLVAWQPEPLIGAAALRQLAADAARPEPAVGA